MSLIPEVRREVYAAAVRHTTAGMSPRLRRGERLGGVAVIAVAVAVVAVVAIVALTGHGSTGGNRVAHGGGQAPSPAQARGLVLRAEKEVFTQDPGCRPKRSHQRLLDGPPDRGFTAVLGVFGRPAPPAHRIPLRVLRTFSGYNGIYARYARKGMIDGVRYSLIPERNLMGVKPLPARCGQESLAAFRKLAKRLLASKRNAAIVWGTQILRSIAAQNEDPAGVEFHWSDGTNDGGSTKWFITRIRSYHNGGDFGGGQPQFTLTPLLLPNNVASVTADYPAVNQDGHVAHHVVTQQVKNNFVIFRIRGGWDPPSLTYRAANGAILWTSPVR
jgi:hypothetical protein